MTTRSSFPAKMADLIAARANVALRGSPGSRKSWLIDQVHPLLAELGVTVAQIDLSTARNGRDVFQAISAAISDEPEASRLESGDLTLQEAWRKTRTAVEGHPRLLVLLVDQFDRVIRFPDAQDFLLRFRELIHRPETLGCVALVASRRSLQNIEVIVQGISTLASICYPEYLGGVGLQDFEPAWGVPEGVTIEQRVACLEWSGGHPSLVKYWLATRPDIRPDAAAETQRTTVIFRVLDYLEDAKLLDAAAQVVLGPILDDWTLESQELELLGIVSDASVDDATYSLSQQDIFCDALRSRTWDMNPWGIFGHCEIATRTMIESVLSHQFGVDWVDELSVRHRAIRTVRAEALEKLERDKKTFKRHGSWLSYTYPADLWSIMAAEWPLFESVFSTHDKKYRRNVF